MRQTRDGKVTHRTHTLTYFEYMPVNRETPKNVKGTHTHTHTHSQRCATARIQNGWLLSKSGDVFVGLSPFPHMTRNSPSLAVSPLCLSRSMPFSLPGVIIHKTDHCPRSALYFF